MPIAFDRLLETVNTLTPAALRHAVIYPLRKGLAEARWTLSGARRNLLGQAVTLVRALTNPFPRWPRRWTTPGRARYIEPIQSGAVVVAERGTVELLFLAADLVRVRYRPLAGPAPAEPVPYAIDRPPESWPTPELVPLAQKDAYLLQSTALTVGVRLDNATLFFADASGTLLRSDIGASIGSTGRGAGANPAAVRHRAALAPGEQLFGLGERTTPLDRRGRTHILWNADPAGYQDGDDPIDLNIPVYVGTVPGPDGTVRSYLIFYENTHYGEFDLGGSEPDIADHRFAGGELRYYFAAGPVPSLIERYTELTGRHPLPPLWMLGYQQSRWSYDSEARVRKLAQDFQEHQVPCDAIHIDIDYMDGFRCFTWKKRTFPTPARLAADLRMQGIRLITIIDPGIKRDGRYHVYRQGRDADYFCTTPDGNIFHAPVWPGSSAFPDFTDPPVRAWWGELYRPMLETGIAGFWNDMNEPAAFASTTELRTVPMTLRHALEGRGGNHVEAHNVYGMQMVRASREGLERLAPDRRPVVITRAGWAGVQRYATSWTGDNYSTWESLRLTVPMVISLGLSGLGFTGPDVGGFIGEPTGELFARWVQAAAFMPFFRAHVAKGWPDQEPWSYGEPYLSIVRRFIELRYELLPYLYTATWQMCTRGWPVVRPVAWSAPEDADLWKVDDSFLCGDGLLIAPVMAPGADRRDVTLPPGAWYDFWTNRVHAGAQTRESFAPLESMPILIREGTVLPLGEPGPNTDQRKQKFLRLFIYPLRAPGDAVSELYEDAGEGLAYQTGAYRHTRLRLHQETGLLTLNWEQTGDYVPPYEHIELTLNGLDRVPQSIEADGDAYAILQADPVRRTVLLAVPTFRQLRVTL